MTVVVGFDAGGVTDVMARLFSKSLSQHFGQAFVVENRNGAAGTLAAGYVARATPDGYTLLFAAAPQMLAAPKIQATKFDAARDFSTIASVGGNSFVLVIRPSIPAKTIPEFVTYAKSHPLTYGSPGAGSITHLLSALFLAHAGVEATHVPFRGGDQALVAMLGGGKYFFLRDRKGLLTAPIAVIAYMLMFGLLTVELLFRMVPSQQQPDYFLLSTSAYQWLLAINVLFLINRIVQRMYFTATIYGVAQGLMAGPRMIVSNLLNFFATLRASYVYAQHKITGKPLVWDKTHHVYPIHEIAKS